MSIKCSLLGHRFDETTVEREREEEGTEVVITITEVETCSRCGESRVVSENKEVTSLESPAESAGGTTTDTADAGQQTGHSEPNVAAGTGAAETADSGTAEATEAGAADTETPDTAGGDGGDAEIIDAESDEEADAQAEARGSATTIPDAEGETTTTAAEDDDAVILDESTGDESTGESAGQATTDGAAETQAEPADAAEGGEEGGEAAAGQAGESAGAAATGEEAPDWPDEPDEGGPESTAAWPDEGVASGPTTEPTEDDWPEETKRDVGADESGSGPELEPTEGATITVPEGKFKCSECGFTTEVESSSLRAGDFCPECHQGTLMQDTDGE